MKALLESAEDAILTIDELISLHDSNIKNISAMGRTAKNRHNISPIEVKSGKNYTIKSLSKFVKKYAGHTHIPYVLHTGDLKDENGILYLPLYMTLCL